MELLLFCLSILTFNLQVIFEGRGIQSLLVCSEDSTEQETTPNSSLLV